MPNALEEVAGGVPKAPTPPDIEDVLGPPPHAPRLGGRGKALATANRYRRPPSPPHVGRRVPSASSQQNASQPQRIVLEQKAPSAVVPTRKKTLQEEYAPEEPEINPHAGKPIYRAARNASKIADKINPLRRQQREAEAEEAQGIPPEMKAKRAEQYAQMRATLDAMRNNTSETSEMPEASDTSAAPAPTPEAQP